MADKFDRIYLIEVEDLTDQQLTTADRIFSHGPNYEVIKKIRNITILEAGDVFLQGLLQEACIGNNLVSVRSYYKKRADQGEKVPK